MRGHMPGDYDDVLDKLNDFRDDILFADVREGLKVLFVSELKRHGDEMYAFGLEEAIEKIKELSLVEEIEGVQVNLIDRSDAITKVKSLNE